MGIKIVFFGTPQYAVPSFLKLVQHPDLEVLGVVTQPDKRRGRGGELNPSPVKQAALAHPFPIWQPKRIKADPEVTQALRDLCADVFVVVAYGQILSQTILDLPRLGSINAHGSLLPLYRGAAPIQWCLYDGMRETGVTTMLMDAGMDTGAMLLKQSLDIPLLFNAQDLAERMADLSADLLVETLLQLEQGSLQAIPQNPEAATYARLIQKSDYALDWSRSAIALHHQIRGFFPHCVATLESAPLKILASIPIVDSVTDQLPPEFQGLSQWMQNAPSASHEPGTVVGLAKGFGPILQTGAGLILLYEVQPQGKRPQRGWDFVNGQRLKIGDRIENG